MKTLSLFAVLTAVLLVTLSCEKTRLVSTNENVFFDLVDGDASFRSQMGDYEAWFTNPAGYQNVTCFSNSLYYPVKSCRCGGYTQANLHSEDRLDLFFVNDLSNRTFMDYDRAEQNTFIDDNSGEEVTFKFVEQEKEIYKETLYLPQDIEVDLAASQIVQYDQSNVGQLSFGQPLYLKADPQNTAGLLISMSYRGLSLNATLDDIQDSDAEAESILRYLYVPEDNGRVDFPEGFFNGVPDQGMFTLQINRANYKLFDLDGELNKLTTSKKRQLDLALMR
ncbi:MAG: hypothetical protein AAGJ82_06605 [Bacteroidota bacterium]